MPIFSMRDLKDPNELLRERFVPYPESWQQIFADSLEQRGLNFSRRIMFLRERTPKTTVIFTTPELFVHTATVLHRPTVLSPRRELFSFLFPRSLSLWKDQHRSFRTKTAMMFISSLLPPYTAYMTMHSLPTRTIKTRSRTRSGRWKLRQQRQIRASK